MNSSIKMSDSTFRLAKIFFMISIASRSVSFNFLINFFSNSCNCSWNSSFVRIRHSIPIDFHTNMMFSTCWKIVESHHLFSVYLRMSCLIQYHSKLFIIYWRSRFDNICHLCWFLKCLFLTLFLSFSFIRNFD